MPKGEPLSFLSDDWSLADVPEQYLSNGGGVGLIAIGKIHTFGEGCACPMGALSKNLIGRIGDKDADYIFVDTEAGIEHFGRGIEEKCDQILAVVEPSYESILLCSQVGEMGEKIGKSVHYILNKVDDENEFILSESIPATEIVGCIPRNAVVAAAGLTGSPMEIALPEIDAIADFIEETSERN